MHSKWYLLQLIICTSACLCLSGCVLVACIPVSQILRAPWRYYFQSQAEVLRQEAELCLEPDLKKDLQRAQNEEGKCGVILLCAVRVPGEPVLTTAATCSTEVRSSLGSARLPQWSKTQAYASNVYSLLSWTEYSAQVARQMQGSCGHGFYVVAQGAGPVRSFSFAQLRWSGFIGYSAPCPKAG